MVLHDFCYQIDQVVNIFHEQTCVLHVQRKLTGPCSTFIGGGYCMTNTSSLLESISSSTVLSSQDINSAKRKIHLAGIKLECAREEVSPKGFVSLVFFFLFDAQGDISARHHLSYSAHHL